VLYHAAAVIAAGHTVALFDQAMALLGRCGFTPEDARAALQPLSRGALDNLAVGPPADAITGPITRGDVATIAAHLAALADAGDAQTEATYRLLARRALALSAAALPAEAASALRATLGVRG
jgi:predicted short-subunit dehydrogenase-like oxidoreductase (DUF2520 family)